MMDEPSPAELLTVTSRLLRDEVMPTLTGYRNYQVRVAANVLDILARQWAQQPDADRREREALAALLDRDGSLADLNAALCAEIEAGRITRDTPGLDDALWSGVLDRLAIDQPRYSAYVKETATE